MTKSKFKILFSGLIVVGAISFYFYHQHKSSNTPEPEEIKINGRVVINAQNKLSSQDIKKLKPKNIPAPETEWKKNVEKSLRLQGGNAIKEMKIELMESMIWVQNNNALNVESLKITLKHKNNREVIFRALVDSNNGKILQTWDQPVICPINPRGEPGIQIDPRYFSN